MQTSGLSDVRSCRARYPSAAEGHAFPPSVLWLTRRVSVRTTRLPGEVVRPVVREEHVVLSEGQAQRLEMLLELLRVEATAIETTTAAPDKPVRRLNPEAIGFPRR